METGIYGNAHIFSASLPPASVTAVLAAIRIIDEVPERRMELIKNARFLAEGLNEKMKKTWDIHTLLKMYPRDLKTAY